MWPWTDWKLRRALRRYRRERDLEAVLQMDWHRDLDLSAFFTDVEERLHGEEITRLRQKQAEYLALQNQINPHFLYNALEAIRTDALLANCPDIAETTEALATFFRYTISNVQEYVTFSDELDNAENYFTIQRCRFGDKISLELELENERLLEVRMPKLILQPLVENAVSHGLEGKLGHGTVRIIVENSDRTFFLRVRDDGVGMPDEQVERLNAQFGGVGGADMTQPCGGIALEEGFEIVTHPMSLSYQLQQIPWEQICKGAVDLGYTSHQAGTCGLHVHVSRLAFGETEEQQDTAIARVLYFFEKHWEELLKFSRRTQHQLDQWASRYGYKEQPMEILDHAKKGYHGGRYTCVNLTNRDTIEFRMFRGTLKYNTLIATLQLVDRICDVAIYLSDDELKALSWTSFVSGCQAPELVRYLKERRLYVNEPVMAEVEV